MLVLNASFEPINVCTVRRAVVLLLKAKAEVVDHVIPRSKGGGSTWDNIVASCAPCNRRKADHLPDKAGMHPRRTPSMPQPHVFIHVATPTIPAAWRQWLPEAA